MSVTFYSLTADNHLVEDAAARELEVNLSNLNAYRVLDSLGLLDVEYPSDLTGHRTGEQFLGAVLLAVALVPEDAGVPAVQTGNWVECGRSEGYLQERFAQLSTLAHFCVQHGYRVCWA